MAFSLPTELKKLGGTPIDPKRVLVLEDAPSGLASGLAAGCQTLAVCTGDTRERIRATPATYRVVDFDRLVYVAFTSRPSLPLISNLLACHSALTSFNFGRFGRRVEVVSASPEGITLRIKTLEEEEAEEQQ